MGNVSLVMFFPRDSLLVHSKSKKRESAWKITKETLDMRHSPCNCSEQEPMGRSIQLPYVILTDWCYLKYIFSFVIERQFRSSDAVTSIRFLIVISHGTPTGVSLIRSL